MKILLFVEGRTEYVALPAFFQKTLIDRLDCRIEIEPINFQGKNKLISDARKKVEHRLGLDKTGEIAAIVSLLDLYEAFEFQNQTTIEDKYEYAKKEIEQKVSNQKFTQFFAVHELEAWLLADPDKFPEKVKAEILKVCNEPEKVNFDNPPSKFLDRLYRKLDSSHEGYIEKYKKVTDGVDLFKRIDTNKVYERCPSFRKIIDFIVETARKHNN